MSKFPRRSVSSLFDDPFFKDHDSLMPMMSVALNELVNDLHGKNSRFVQRIRDNKGYPKIRLATQYEEESAGKYLVQAAVPGYSDEQITVHTEQDQNYTYLILKGKMADKDTTSQLYNEVFQNDFFRKIPLPENISEDSIDATLKDGVLTISWDIIDPEEYSKENVKKIQINKS